MRHSLTFRKKAVADKPVIPVVRIAYLDFVIAIAYGGRNIDHPRWAPYNAAVNGVHEDMRKTGRNTPEGED